MIKRFLLFAATTLLVILLNHSYTSSNEGSWVTPRNIPSGLPIRYEELSFSSCSEFSAYINETLMSTESIAGVGGAFFASEEESNISIIQQSDGSFIGQVNIAYEFTVDEVRLPRIAWTDMTQEERSELQVTLDNLLIHELGHVDIGEKVAADLSTVIEVPSPSEPRVYSEQQLNDLIKERIDQQENIAREYLIDQQLEYDRLTDHGRSQTNADNSGFPSGENVTFECPEKEELDVARIGEECISIQREESMSSGYLTMINRRIVDQNRFEVTSMDGNQVTSSTIVDNGILYSVYGSTSEFENPREAVESCENGFVECRIINDLIWSRSLSEIEDEGNLFTHTFGFLQSETDDALDTLGTNLGTEVIDGDTTTVYEFDGALAGLAGVMRTWIDANGVTRRVRHLDGAGQLENELTCTYDKPIRIRVPF